MSKFGEELIAAMKDAVAYGQGRLVAGTRTTVIDRATGEVLEVREHPPKKPEST